MTQNQTVNAALLALGSFLVGSVPTLYYVNFWQMLSAAVAGVAVFVLYELLP